PVVGTVAQKAKRFLKRIGQIIIPHHDSGNYEPSGNYVFTIAEREIEKIALGLALPAVAFKRYHDIYIAGVEDQPYHKDSSLLKATLRKHSIMKMKRALGFLRKNNIQVIIFKEVPDVKVIQALKDDKYEYVALPKN